jgi:4-amino-4-deoxy-L-arabinose transferase-like glycosyltransferase
MYVTHRVSAQESTLQVNLARGNLSSFGVSDRRTWPARMQWALVAGTLSLFVVLGFWYSMAVPAFEKPDEVYHYAFAQLLAGGNSLPIQTGEISGPWAQEGSQPPLYYWILGRLISWVDLSDFDEISQVNPHANIGDPLYPGNKNLMLHSAVSRPLRGTNLAVHIGRWFSLLLGVVTLWLIYRIARLVFPGSALMAWLVLATVAAVPQVAFISSSVSNDSLIVLLSTAVIYWLARLLARPDDRPIPRWEWLVLGLLAGLAALSKLQGLGLFVLVGIVVIWLASRRRCWQIVPEALAQVLLPAALIAGWWYWRNYRLYGDWLGVVSLFTANGLRHAPQTWGGFWGEMQGLRDSFWGLFGWFNILLPVWVYRALDALTMIAVAGVVSALIIGLFRRRVHLTSRPEQRIAVLLAIWAMVIVGSLVASSLVVLTSQGRLAFPALSAFGVLFVAGLAFWVRLPTRLVAGTRPRTTQSRAGGRGTGPDAVRMLPVLGLLPLALLLCSLYSLTIVLPRSYLPQPPVLALPDDARPALLRFADHLELVGVRLPQGRFGGGESVPLTLYWRTDTRLSRDYALFVQLLDENRQTIANATSHPGWGRNPTTLWQPGAIYPDSYELAIPGGLSSRAPMLATVYVGFIDPASGAPFQARDANGAPVEGMLGRIPLVSSRKSGLQTRDVTSAHVMFQDSMHLAGYAYPGTVKGPRQAVAKDGSSIVVRLLWEASGQPQDEYTAFVHLVGSGGQPVTGFDRLPADGGFTTAYWEKGDRFLSDFTLSLPPDLPPGDYQLWAGLYRSSSQGNIRLPVHDADRPVQDDRVLLGNVKIQ